jgi:predicted ATPase
MLKQIELKYFKCFELLKLPLANLTLLSGTNASGKSSVLQALVLLNQTMSEHEWATRLMLNGNTLKLGTVADVVDKVNGRTIFQISLANDENFLSWYFQGDRLEMSMEVKRVELESKPYEDFTALHYLMPVDEEQSTSSLVKRLLRLTYITAERLGPRDVYPLEDKLKTVVVGPSGEYAVSVLHIGREETVLPSLQIEDVPPTRLRQVEAWMQKFFPGCGLAIEQVSRMNAVTLGLRTSDDTDYHRPVHVGFGLTQVLPIVIAAMSAEENDLLLIENPEVHLHPAGQVLMGQFLAQVASAGIQVILETHSDHILNGIRRSVKSQVLSPEQVALHFFRPRQPNTPQVISPLIDIAGNLDQWPEGFFDQFDKDMNFFAGWGE